MRFAFLSQAGSTNQIQRPDAVRTDIASYRTSHVPIAGNASRGMSVSTAMARTRTRSRSRCSRPSPRRLTSTTSQSHATRRCGPRTTTSCSTGRERIARPLPALRALSTPGGRFGYRMYYPPMRAGMREVFWHLPLVARDGAGRFLEGPLGYATAEAEGVRPLRLAPRLLARPAHLAAARLFERDVGHSRVHHEPKHPQAPRGA